MSEAPGSGAGPYGPQGPYGSSPTPPPQQPPVFGQQPPQDPYGQRPSQNPYGPSQTPVYGVPAAPPPSYGPAPQYGTSVPSATPPTGTPVYGAGSTPTPSSYTSAPSATPGYGPAQTAPQPSWPAAAPQPYGSPPMPAPQPYVPGQSGQGWSGDNRPPKAYAGAARAYPPDPPVGKKSRTGLVIGVVAVVLVLLVGGGFIVSQALKKPSALSPISTPSVAPTSKASASAGSSTATTSASASASASASTSASATASSTSYPGFTQSGSTLSGSNFSTALPTGWTLSATNGGKNEGEIIDAYNNLIDYYSGYQRSAADNCAYQASAIASAAGVESAQPAVAVNGVMWAGQPATGVEVTLKRASQTQQEVLGYYCLDRPDGSVLVRSIAWATDRATVQSGAKQLLSNWKWQ